MHRWYLNFVKNYICFPSLKVVVLQEYHNTSSSTIEAKYVFPLDDMAAVCGFEAFINGKHIVGEVKEKETAHKEYEKAISEGHGAYLMDQDEETPVRYFYLGFFFFHKIL